MEKYINDFISEKTKILPLLIGGGKILNFTHVDMDGIGSNIVLSKRLKNVVKIEVNYQDIDERIMRFDFNEYDAVIFTDICPNLISLNYLKTFHNVIILDHHDTAIEHHDPKSCVFIYNGISGTKLTFEFMKVMFGDIRQFAEIEQLVDIINDYDLWIHANPKSIYFNWLYYRYKSDGFKSRFISGDIKLLNDEKKFIQTRSDELRDIFHKLEIFEFDSVNAAMFFTDDFINDLGDLVLKKYAYDIILIVNPGSFKVSVRSLNDIEVGTMLKSLGLGGGHKNAGGFKSADSSEFNNHCSMIEQYVYRFYKATRK